MSSSIEIGVALDKGCQYEHLVAILERLRQRGAIRAALTTRYGFDRTPIRLDATAGGLVALIQQITPSDCKLEILFDYTLASGRVIGISAEIIGEGFLNGIGVKNKGPFNVSLSYASLIEPLRRFQDVTVSAKDIAPDLLACPAPSLSLRHQVMSGDLAEASRAGARVVKDAEELFLRVCGASNEFCDTAVLAAAMYCDSAWWPAPHDCSMMFHRSCREFARDIVRMYVAYHWYPRMPEMLSPGADLWSFEHAADGEHELAIKKHDIQSLGDVRDPIVDESLRAIAFIAGLDRSMIERLGGLSSAEVRRLFASINTAATCIADFDDAGLALLDAPRVGLLWRTYKAVYDHYCSQ